MKYLIIILSFLFYGCATGQGGNWWLVDYDKVEDSDVNYQELKTDELEIGMSKFDVISILGENFKVNSLSSKNEIISYQKWKLNFGADVYEYSLFLNFENEKLKEWRKSRK